MNKIKKYFNEKAISSIVRNADKQKKIERKMLVLAVKYSYYEVKIDSTNYIYKKINGTGFQDGRMKRVYDFVEGMS